MKRKTPAATRRVPSQGLLTLRQTATLLGVRLRTLEGWVADGRLRVVRPGGRLVRVTRAEVARLSR